MYIRLHSQFRGIRYKVLLLSIVHLFSSAAILTFYSASLHNVMNLICLYVMNRHSEFSKIQYEISSLSAVRLLWFLGHNYRLQRLPCIRF